MRGSTKLYGWLLKLYPARFREEYETPMERQFHDEYRDADRKRDIAALWLRAVWDLATSAPPEVLRELRLDLKHAARVYRKRSFSTILAVAALALAIGASTGVFSVLNALLIRSLPFSDPGRLVEIWFSPVSPINGRTAFTEWHRKSPYLQNAAAFSLSDMNLAGDRDALRVKVAETSANFFKVLGVSPVVGRTFTQDEDISGHNHVAVISYGLWQQIYGGDSEVAGRLMRVNGMPLTIIGVAPSSFDYPGKMNIWIPTIFDFEKLPKRGAFLFRTVGRLKQDVDIRAAQEMFGAEVRRANPGSPVSLSAGEENLPRIISLQSQLAGPVGRASWVLASMTLLVLLTAFANVAQLLLSRATERRQELAVRAALGASRARLLQQLTTEATLLTMTGAAMGIGVAYWTSKIASSFVPAQLATQQYAILDWRVLCFATALALAMGLTFGVLPVWLIGRINPAWQVVRNQSGKSHLGTKRPRAALVALQVALTLCLVTSSLALGQTFLRLLHTDLGFRPANVLTLNVSVQGMKYPGPREWQYYSETLSRLRTMPGVEAAGAVSHLPLATDIYMANSFKLDSGQSVKGIVMNAVMPGYFNAMEMRFIAGRDFAENQGHNSAPSVIVNQAFAERAGLGQMIVGRMLTAPWNSAPYRIRGLVNTTSFAGPADPGGPQIYWPVEEEPGPALTLVARVSGPPEAYLARCRDALKSVDPKIPVYDVKTLDERVADVLSRPRFYTTATLFLAVLAVLLATVGIYGTVVQSVAQRRREMGVRMAVGASYAGIRTMMVRESLVPVVFGIAVGIAGSIVSGRYLGHLIENAALPELRTAIAAAAFLLVTGLIAAWSATARILVIDPAEVMRSE